MMGALLRITSLWAYECKIHFVDDACERTICTAVENQNLFLNNVWKQFTFQTMDTSAELCYSCMYFSIILLYMHYISKAKFSIRYSPTRHDLLRKCYIMKI